MRGSSPILIADNYSLLKDTLQGLLTLPLRHTSNRPHDSLNDLTPWEYLAKHSSTVNSIYSCN